MSKIAARKAKLSIAAILAFDITHNFVISILNVTFSVSYDSDNVSSFFADQLTWERLWQTKLNLKLET